MTRAGAGQGRLIGVVGPSGAGKDSVIAGLIAARPGLTCLRRTITRPAEAGGEVFDAVSAQEFAARQAAGDFVLTWGAHGLFYGIPREGLAPLAEGRDLLVNLSRGVLAQAMALGRRLSVLQVTARPETLAARLAQRGRETAEEIGGRLARQVAAFPPGIDIVTVANDGPLHETVAAALAGLYPAERG